MEKTVLVVIPAEERHKEKLERAGKGCRFVYVTPQTATEEMIEAAAEQDDELMMKYLDGE